MNVLGNNYPRIDLASATVLITGAGRGIGKATAAAFAATGARVALADVDRTAVDQAATEIGSAATAYTLDVRSRVSWDKVVADLGRVDVLVNNAGIMPIASFLEESDDVIDATMGINVLGLVHGMRAVVPAMIDRGFGHVVNVCSLAGKLPIPGLAIYNASKFGAVGLTQATRLEFAPHGVSVSGVLPSAVRTGLTSGLQLGHGMPTVDPEDIAAAILETCKSRRAEVPVPGYLSALDLGLAVTPERVLNLVRRAAGGDRALVGVDRGARAEYAQRVKEVSIEQ
ncbi:SDR family oxidoreductase [Antrihabitans cavernicola]|uniref:SDR family oxidoreductase n=1 Tax=Antrihabitans cavernicola TaxID=2495913 RepID=A0A5A7SDI9_9NOCA|nr:SDR family oxidoreductase [Spelaeibacter cavernicola]KAA0022653.1 SDR family oxidoreductase [Spelaeibacter cavernicola]